MARQARCSLPRSVPSVRLKMTGSGGREELGHRKLGNEKGRGSSWARRTGRLPPSGGPSEGLSPLWCPRLEGEGVGPKLSVAPLSPCSVVLPIRDPGQWQQATLSFLLPAGPCQDPISVPVA